VFPGAVRKHQGLVDPAREPAKPGGLRAAVDWRAYALPALRGDHLRGGQRLEGRGEGGLIHGIEGFWSCAKRRLYPLRGAPRKGFRLYSR